LRRGGGSLWKESKGLEEKKTEGPMKTIKKRDEAGSKIGGGKYTTSQREKKKERIKER